MANYVAVHQYMPYERMVDLVRDTYGAKVSTGTLVAMVNRGGTRVRPAVEEIKRQLVQAAVVNVDETGLTSGRVEVGSTRRRGVRLSRPAW